MLASARRSYHIARVLIRYRLHEYLPDEGIFRWLRLAARLHPAYYRDAAEHATLCDVRLSGDLAGYLQLFKHTPSDTPRGKLHIEGDLHTAQQFQRVMGELAPDYAAVLRARFGDDFGSLLADALRRLQSMGTSAKAACEAKLRNYLENHGCATRTDAAAFATRLAALISRIDRLETRLAKETR